MNKINSPNSFYFTYLSADVEEGIDILEHFCSDLRYRLPRIIDWVNELSAADVSLLLE